MSGTSLDGVDGICVRWPDQDPISDLQVLGFVHQDFAPDLRNCLFALQTSAPNELDTAMRASNDLAITYAQAVTDLLEQASIPPDQVNVIGAHGQTVRHCPELKPAGYTVQLLNAALLVEKTGIAVVHDFRSRDIAAGGQGAPLVPAFHARRFACAGETQVVCNLGGIANITVLHGDGRVEGMDTGPGNCLMDYWAQLHLNQPYDRFGAWAATGSIHAGLQAKMLEEPYFKRASPKSTGRDLFNPHWLAQRLSHFPAAKPADIQATLADLTVQTVADAIECQAPGAGAVWLCGGGAFNATVVQGLQNRLQCPVRGTSVAGVPELHVEAMAFAWMARAHLLGQSANVPAVTGAHGPRILGSFTPA
jgi:anhydro-N-acetylmuramic acid kinase